MQNLNSSNILLKVNNLNVKVSFWKNIIKKVNLEVKENDIIILKGDNGTGKTTLIEYLSNQIKSRNVWRRKKIQIGYVPQMIEFKQSVKKILESFSKMLKIKLPNNIYQAFSLEKIKDSSFESISSGEKQRTLLALSLLKKPNILILDEFLRGLDITSKNSFYKFIKTLQKKYHFAIIYITHSNDDVLTTPTTYWSIKNKLLEVKNENKNI